MHPEILLEYAKTRQREVLQEAEQIGRAKDVRSGRQTRHPFRHRARVNRLVTAWLTPSHALPEVTRRAA